MHVIFILSCLGKGNDLARWRWHHKGTKQPEVVKAMIDAKVAPCTLHMDKRFISAEVPPGLFLILLSNVI